MRKPQSSVADFEDGVIEPRPKDYRWPLEARKGKKTNTPLDPPEGMKTP